MGIVSNVKFFCVTSFLCAAALFAGAAQAGGELAVPENPFSSAMIVDSDSPTRARWDVFLSGYAWHDRDTYTQKQLNKMNENTLGGGIGRSIRNERGNDEGVYVIRIRDSNERPQWMAGYVYQWVFPVVSKYEVSAGLTALLIRRHDWFDGRPFPAVLPVASFGTHKAQLTATYVPHLSMRKGKGNIVLLMLKMSL